MKRVLILMAFVSMAAVGCQTHSQLGNQNCQTCGPGGQGQGQYAGGGAQNSADYVPQIPKQYYRETQPAGPATGTYAYPYYTSRGPRDFFLDAPSTIGY